MHEKFLLYLTVSAAELDPTKLSRFRSPCRYLLSQHPLAEARVAQELEDLELLVTPERPSPRPLEYADLAKLPYLQAVMKVEVLRLSLPAFRNLKTAK